MRCVIFVAGVILFSPWIVLVGGKKAKTVIAQSSQLAGKQTEAQLPVMTHEELVEEFARAEAQRQATVVKQLERDAAERQAATLRLIEKQTAERQAIMMQKIRRDVSTRQAVMMKQAQLEARKRNATSRLGARGWPTH